MAERDPNDILKTVFQLNDHPFSSMIDQPLDPTIHVDDLRLFFDFYQWHNKDVIYQIDHVNGLRLFQPQRGNDPMLIILSGYDSSGRTSLSKLILSTIRQKVGKAPLEITQHFSHKDLNIQARDLSQAFIDICSFDLPEDLRRETMFNKIQEDGARHEQLNPGTGYMNVFQRLKTVADRTGVDSTIVFKVTGVNDYDGWQNLYGLVRPLANYLVVVTEDETEAKVARKALPRQALRFASITAPKLHAETAEKFLRYRLSSDRKAGSEISDLSPFDESAIQALFRPGAGHDAHSVSWQIGWLIQKLAFALDRHLDTLGQDVGATTEQMRATLIDDARISEYLRLDKQPLLG